jgi:putative redox protein
MQESLGLYNKPNPCNMSEATVSIEKSHYRMQAVSGGNNVLIADEPEEVGGANMGFSPDELLCSALGACTAATLRMYADRKEWPLESVEVKVAFQRESSFSSTKIVRNIKLQGDLSEDQRERLLDIANKCPVHKTLTQPIEIETTV